MRLQAQLQPEVVVCVLGGEENKDDKSSESKVFFWGDYNACSSFSLEDLLGANTHLDLYSLMVCNSLPHVLPYYINIYHT